MRISNLIESHSHEGRRLLRESCDGLTESQRVIVEGIYKEMSPLIEASLAPQQIQQLFGEIEKAATAGGDNRTVLGKGVDVAKKADDVIDNIGKWLQNTTPVKMFDQKFDQLKNKINTSFPDSKILDGISQLGMYAKNNPGKTAAIIGVLTAIAALAGGPVGGAIAGQVLRGAVELLKGEKLSTAVGKGIKTAAYGFIAGKTFELIGDALSGSIKMVKDSMFPGAVRSNFTRIFDEVGGPLGDRYATFELKDLVGLPQDVRPLTALANEAADAWKAGDYALSKTIWGQVKDGVAVLDTPEYLAQLASNAEARQLASKGMKAVVGLADFMGAAAQGAIAAGTGTKDKKESVVYQTRPLSEGQVYLVFSKIEQLNEGPIDWIKDKASKAAGAVAQKAQQVGTNLTTKVTANKLNSAWQKAGAPTDTDELAQFLEKQGVDSETVKTTYAGLKLPAPGAGAEAAKQKTDFENVKKMIMALPTDRKVRLLKFLTKQSATPQPQV